MFREDEPAGYDLEPRGTKVLEDEDDDEYENDRFGLRLIFLQHRHSLADLTPAGKIPGIGKPGALIGFHRIDSAVLTLEKNATSIGTLLQS